MTTDNLEGFLSGGGAPAAKFVDHGATIKGTITSAELRQQTDLDGKPKTWDDGNPRMQIVVTLATDERDNSIDNDDGSRRVFVRGEMLKALRAALKQADVKTIEVGGTLAVRYVSDGSPSRAGFNAPKLYNAQYKPPATKGVDLSVDDLL